MALEAREPPSSSFGDSRRDPSALAALVLFLVVSTACTGAGLPTTSSQDSTIEIGVPAPSFELRSSEGDIRSRDLLGTKPVLFYFSMGPG